MAIGVFGMPWQSAAAAAGYAPASVCSDRLDLLAAVFLYVLTVEAGELREGEGLGRGDVADKRIQARLESRSVSVRLSKVPPGFATAVAISAAA